MFLLVIATVVGVVMFTGQMGSAAELEQMTQLHDSHEDVADALAILASTGKKDEMGTIPASIAALAAQVC